MLDFIPFDFKQEEAKRLREEQETTFKLSDIALPVSGK